jgi:hypothetical protein
VKREMYLSKMKYFRSNTDVSTFPSEFQGDLNHPWKYRSEQRRIMKKPREESEILNQTPTNKIRECDVESLNPIVKMVLEQKLETSDPSLISELKYDFPNLFNLVFSTRTAKDLVKMIHIPWS